MSPGTLWKLASSVSMPVFTVCPVVGQRSSPHPAAAEITNLYLLGKLQTVFRTSFLVTLSRMNRQRDEHRVSAMSAWGKPKPPVTISLPRAVLPVLSGSRQ